MQKRKSGFLFVVVIAFMLLGQSCGKKPFACFHSFPGEDSIHVNVPVTFNASCSLHANEYNWEFYDSGDSVDFGQIVTKTFKDTGTVKVYLLVVDGLNSAGSTRMIHVQP